MTGSGSSNIYYVYLHRKETTGEVFYVGKGKDDRAYKLIGRNRWWKNIVKKHGYTVEFVCKDISEEQAVSEEKRLIAQYGRLDLGTGCLCNLTDGGEGSSGARVSEESRRKRSESLQKHREMFRQRMLGKKLSRESIAKIQAKKAGFKHSEKTKKQISDKKKQRYLDVEFTQKMAKIMADRAKDENFRRKIAAAKGAKPFLAYKDKELIKEFFSINGAAVELGLSCAGIRKVLKGKAKACRGFVFCYKDNKENRA